MGSFIRIISISFVGIAQPKRANERESFFAVGHHRRVWRLDGLEQSPGALVRSLGGGGAQANERASERTRSFA